MQYGISSLSLSNLGKIKVSLDEEDTFIIHYLLMTALICSLAQSRSDFSIISSGAKRMTLSCVSLHSCTFSISLSQLFVAIFFISLSNTCIYIIATVTLTSHNT